MRDDAVHAAHSVGKEMLKVGFLVEMPCKGKWLAGKTMAENGLEENGKRCPTVACNFSRQGH